MKIEIDYIVPEPSRTSPDLIKDLDVSAEYIMHLYNQSNINRKYNDFLKGKSVVIVGPASYLEGKGLGGFFDSFDIVVRLNRSFPVTNTNDYGTRCEIRYHNMSQNNAQGGPLDIDLMLASGVKYVSSPFPKHMDYFHNDIVQCERQLSGSGIEFHHWSDLEQFLTFHMLLNTRPNIGTCAILDLLNYDIKSLYVSGITFFKDGYNSQYSDRDDDLVPAYHANGVANHAQQPQKQLIKLIGEFDTRVTFDDEVKDSL